MRTASSAVSTAVRCEGRAGGAGRPDPSARAHAQVTSCGLRAGVFGAVLRCLYAAARALDLANAHGAPFVALQTFKPMTGAARSCGLRVLVSLHVRSRHGFVRAR